MLTPAVVLTPAVIRQPCHELLATSHHPYLPAFLPACLQGFHEMLATSPHRTFDPEEADFFFMPIYGSCMIFPIMGWADFPWFGPPSGDSSSKYASCLTALYCP